MIKFCDLSEFAVGFMLDIRHAVGLIAITFRRRPKHMLAAGIVIFLAGVLLYAAVERYVAAKPAKQSLQLAIQRNQAELQRISAMIEDNNKEQAWIVADALNDGVGLITSGALSAAKDLHNNAALGALDSLASGQTAAIAVLFSWLLRNRS